MRYFHTVFPIPDLYVLISPITTSFYRILDWWVENLKSLENIPKKNQDPRKTTFQFLPWDVDKEFFISLAKKQNKIPKLPYCDWFDYRAIQACLKIKVGYSSHL